MTILIFKNHLLKRMSTLIFLTTEATCSNLDLDTKVFKKLRVKMVDFFGKKSISGLHANN